MRVGRVDSRDSAVEQCVLLCNETGLAIAEEAGARLTASPAQPASLQQPVPTVCLLCADKCRRICISAVRTSCSDVVSRSVACTALYCGDVYLDVGSVWPGC